MKQADVQQKQVALRSGLGQSTIAGYLTGARNPNNANIVHRVVQGVLPNNAPEDVAAEVLHDGLLAAGFAARPLSPAAALIREALDGRGEDIHLTPEEFDVLMEDIEDYALHRLSRTVEKQKQEAA